MPLIRLKRSHIFSYCQNNAYLVSKSRFPLLGAVSRRGRSYAGFLGPENISEWLIDSVSPGYAPQIIYRHSTTTYRKVVGEKYPTWTRRNGWPITAKARRKPQCTNQKSIVLAQIHLIILSSQILPSAVILPLAPLPPSSELPKTNADHLRATLQNIEDQQQAVRY